MDALLVCNYFMKPDSSILHGGNMNSSQTNNSMNNYVETSTTWGKIMAVVSLFLFVYALHLSYTRNNGFHAGSMLAAYCCTSGYLIWVFIDTFLNKQKTE